MELKQILSKCDHTLLSQSATWTDIKAICDDGIKYATASVCIPPSFVKEAKEYVGEQLKICTVIGFPNGYNTTSVKVFETTLTRSIWLSISVISSQKNTTLSSRK